MLEKDKEELQKHTKKSRMFYHTNQYKTKLRSNVWGWNSIVRNVANYFLVSRFEDGKEHVAITEPFLLL